MSYALHGFGHCGGGCATAPDGLGRFGETATTLQSGTIDAAAKVALDSIRAYCKEQESKDSLLHWNETQKTCEVNKATGGAATTLLQKEILLLKKLQLKGICENNGGSWNEIAETCHAPTVAGVSHVSLQKETCLSWQQNGLPFAWDEAGQRCINIKTGESVVATSPQPSSTGLWIAAASVAAAIGVGIAWFAHRSGERAGRRAASIGSLELSR